MPRRMAARVAGVGFCVAGVTNGAAGVVLACDVVADLCLRKLRMYFGLGTRVSSGLPLVVVEGPGVGTLLDSVVRSASASFIADSAARKSLDPVARYCATKSRASEHYPCTLLFA